MTGPWTVSVELRPFATGHWYVVLDAEENGIGEFYGDDHETNVANLRVAAAAPELYDALAAIVLNARLPSGRTRSGRVTIPAADYHFARALVAKARADPSISSTIAGDAA